MSSSGSGLRAFLIAGCMLVWGQTWAAEHNALQIGVLPNLSARLILANYQPLRQLLERDLGRTVDIVTAPDFRSFAQRTQAGFYDVVVTAAHLARIAQLDAPYVVLGANAPAMKGLLVMSRERPVGSVQQLRHATLAIANPQSLVAMRGLAWLRERGLVSGTDYRIVRAANEDSLGRMLVQGEAVLAMLSGVEFGQMPEDLRQRLQPLVEFAEVRNFVWLVHRRTPEREIEVLRNRLRSLTSSAEGRRFLAAAGIESWGDLEETALQGLDPLLGETRRLLELTH